MSREVAPDRDVYTSATTPLMIVVSPACEAAASGDRLDYKD
jgi:hypothetical protein